MDLFHFFLHFFLFVRALDLFNERSTIIAGEDKQQPKDEQLLFVSLIRK